MIRPAMADRLEGRTFGDFRVDALVGRGAVGKVYAATQISLKRRVTLKVLDAGLFTPDEFKTRFQREAEVVARLEHPHIVPVYAFGQEESFIYYAVRHVEGKTLEEALADGLPMRAGLRHLADVAGALAYAHARGVVHRDVRPSCITIGDGVAMLSDFGLARLAESTTITEHDALIGSALYMSPEQARRQKATPASDLYALGAIAYELACAKPPFEQQAPRQALLQRVADGAFARPRDLLGEIPLALERLILDLMSADPESRPKHARDLLLEAASLPEMGVLDRARSAILNRAIQSDTPSLAPPSDVPDRRLGKYLLLDKLGQGGMGVVYRARQTDLDRDVALKVMTFGPDIDETSILRFRREAQAAARLRHPNIIAVHEAGTVDGRHYFSMDLVDGESLAKLLDRQTPPARRAMEIMRDVAGAIAHAHSLGVVHRDIKPGNILLDQEGRVFVADFGLAKTVDIDSTKLTQSGYVVGTPSYMAPEQARGSTGLVDTRSDVYSMGALLYHMLTGLAPFSGPDVYQVLHDVIGAEPVAPRKRNDKIHADAETICLKAMDKDPLRRYATAAEMREDVERFLAGEPIHARPAGALTRAARRAKRQPVVTGLAAAVAVLLLVGVALVLAERGALETQRQAHERQLKAAAESRKAQLEYLALQYEKARVAAVASTQLDPAWGPGWFWVARVDLREYAAARPIPAVWVSYGELQFDPVPPETPELRKLRESVEKTLAGAEKLAGMEGWEGRFARGVLAFFGRRYEQALSMMQQVVPREIPDWEIYAYAAMSAYYAKRFDLAVRFALEGKRMWPNRAIFHSLDVNARLAQGRSATLVGGDPLPSYDAALAALGEARPLAGAWDVLEAAVRTARGDALFESGGDAVAEYDLALKLLEGNPAAEARGDVHAARAAALAYFGRVDPDKPAEFEAAIAAYTEAAKAGPERIAPRFKRAEAGAALSQFRAQLGRPNPEGHLDGVIADYESASGFLDARLGAARIRFSRDAGNTQDRLPVARAFVAEVRKAAEAHPHDARARLVAAIAWTTQANVEYGLGVDCVPAYEAALREMSAGLEINPKYAEGLFERATIRSNLHTWFLSEPHVDEAKAKLHREAALADVEAAVKANPRAAKALETGAMVWLDVGHVQLREQEDPREAQAKAQAYLDRALAVSPKSTGLLCLSARLSTQRFEATGAVKFIDEAEAALETALEVNPTCVDALELLARLHYARFAASGEREAAWLDRGIDVCTRALEIVERDERIEAFRASLHLARGPLREAEDRVKDWTAAAAGFEKVLEVNPQNIEARVNLGIALHDLALDSSSPDDKEKHLRASVAALQRAAKDAPGRQSAHLQLGSAAVNLGLTLGMKFQDAKGPMATAVEAIRAAEKLGPIDDRHRYDLARALTFLDRWAEARDEARKLPKGNPEFDALVEEIKTHLDDF